MAIRPGAQGPRGGRHEVSAEAITERAKAAASSDWRPSFTPRYHRRPGVPLTHGTCWRRQERVHGAARPLNADANSSTLLFLPLRTASPHHRGWDHGGRRRAGPLLDMTTCYRLVLQPTFILAVPRVFEKVFNGAEQKAVSEARAPSSPAPPAWPSLERALDTRGTGPGLRCQHVVFDRWFTASCEPLSAARRAARSPAARRERAPRHLPRRRGHVLEGRADETSPAAA